MQVSGSFTFKSGSLFELRGRRGSSFGVANGEAVRVSAARGYAGTAQAPPPRRTGGRTATGPAPTGNSVTPSVHVWLMHHRFRLDELTDDCTHLHMAFHGKKKEQKLAHAFLTFKCQRCPPTREMSAPTKAQGQVACMGQAGCIFALSDGSSSAPENLIPSMQVFYKQIKILCPYIYCM